MATIHYLPKKRGVFQSTEISFLRETNFPDLSQWVGPHQNVMF